MKRLILLLVVVMLVYWVWTRERSMLMRPAGTPELWKGPHRVQDGDTRRHFARAGHEVHRALRKAEHEFHRAVDEVSEAFLSNDDDDEQNNAVQPSAVEREEADGLPVAIVPGTRVTEAQAVPPAPRRPVFKRRAGSKPRPVPAAVERTVAKEAATLAGQISATPERATAQARVDLRQDVRAWLDPDVPSSWTIPERLLDSIILGTELEIVPKDYDEMFIAHLRLDKSPESRARFIEVYNHELVGRRLVNLGGSLGFILICLAAISGYIRADEATRGYYTNRLRMLAAAGVGAGGVLIYQMVT